MGLHLENVHRSFGDSPAVADVSLDVADGEILCLFGPSGCGKTTLLRAVAGFERHRGVVSLDGRRLAADGAFTPPEKRPIGFVFQDFVLFPHLTAEENVAFGLSGLTRTERRIGAQAELDAVGLSGLGARYPHQLSGGQQQRVALARAFSRRPRAMLLDEPFASIDPALRRRLREELRLLLKKSGVATILVTHDADEALALGDRIALMRDGRIVECATPADLYFRPQTVDAAMMFAGAQVLDAATADALATSSTADAGMRRLVVALSGAVAARPDADGPFRVLDCRFEPPGWTATLAAEAGRTVRAAMDQAAEPGARVSIRIEPTLLRRFALDEAPGRV